TRPPLADRAVTRKRSGLRSTRSMAWVPIDPVEPRIATSFGPSPTTGSYTRCGSASGAGASVMDPIVSGRARRRGPAPAAGTGVLAGAGAGPVARPAAPPCPGGSAGRAVQVLPPGRARGGVRDPGTVVRGVDDALLEPLVRAGEHALDDLAVDVV